MDELESHKKLIEEYKEKHGKAYSNLDLVCCTTLSTPLDPTDVRKKMKKIIDDNGFNKLKFHGLRHTHASVLLSRGVNIKMISTRLGHASVKITLDTYSHILPTMEDQLVNQLEEINKTDH